MVKAGTIRVTIYVDDRTMRQGIARMQRRGWQVIDTEVDPQGYGCLKTGCLGLLFFPLALLGKKPNRYKVTFRKV